MSFLDTPGQKLGSETGMLGREMELEVLPLMGPPEHSSKTTASSCNTYPQTTGQRTRVAHTPGLEHGASLEWLHWIMLGPCTLTSHSGWHWKKQSHEMTAVFPTKMLLTDLLKILFTYLKNIFFGRTLSRKCFLFFAPEIIFFSCLPPTQNPFQAIV